MPADRLLHPRLGHSRKVSHLTDFDYRIWTQYLLSADDFGVMRASAVTLQADNDALECRAAKVVERGLEHIIKAELVTAFEHQGRRYVCQRDWQTFQKVEYPRATDNPQPPADVLEQCDDATRELFAKHPGGNGKKKPRTSAESSPSDSENVPQMVAEGSPPTCAGAPAKRLTANANGSRQEADGLRLDDEFAAFVAAYPAQGRTQGARAQHAFFAARQSGVTLSVMLEALMNHTSSEQWAVAGKIPNLERWLLEQRWAQTLPPPKAFGSNPKTAGNLAAAERWLAGREAQRNGTE